jgi:homocysteine S-methyltransferase
MPNAGYPSYEDGRTLYNDNPDYFAGLMARMRDAGAASWAAAAAPRPAHPRHGRGADRGGKIGPGDPKPAPPPAAGVRKSLFDREKIVIVCEMTAPAEPDTAKLLAACARLRDAGADMLTVPDSPLARARASSVMTAALIRRRVGIETIPHLCCRDRNPIAIRGDLVAGAAEGIGCVLAITGDPLVQSEDGRACSASIPCA